MDEDIVIINKTTRDEKIKNFFIKNKKKLYLYFGLFIILIISFFTYQDFLKKKNLNIANRYISASTNFNEIEKVFYLNEFKEIINTNNKTYAPLSLFFLIDNNIIVSKEEINRLFSQIIKNSNLDNEIKNLMIYKKALFNFENKSENELLEMLKPIINSESIWRSHSFLLIGDYFISKGEKQKAKDFYNQILTDEKASQNMIIQAQLKIRRNFNE